MKLAVESVGRVSSYGRLGMFCIVIATGCSVAAFATPFWIQSWPRIHTPFTRLGLWEFCLKGYIHRLDPAMKSYFGCWWIYTNEYLNLRDFLQPWWFRLVQLGMTLTLIFHLASLIVYFVYICRCVTHPERRFLFTRLVTGLMIASSCLLFMVGVTFGARCMDPYWLPNPSLNWPSWSYGLALLSCFFSIFSSILLWRQKKIDARKLHFDTYEFPMIAKSNTKLDRYSASAI